MQKEQEITIADLVNLVNGQDNEFVFLVDFGELFTAKQEEEE